MASPDPEIKEGFSLPVWMKTKPQREFEPFGSPPAPEDNFFYIKYPKTDALFGKLNVEQEMPKVIQEPKLIATAANYKEKDWSKHTKPCQDVLHGIASTATTTKSKPVIPEDDLKGEVAECGNSVVKVAHQMITSRGFTVASPSEEAADEQAYHRQRRGSRSLPTSPAHSPPGSPNSRRRKVGNRYFTSPFEPSEESGGRSWLAAALLGLKKDLSASSSTLVEEAGESRLQGVSLAESVENLGPSPKNKDPKLMSNEIPKSVPAKPSQSYRPKPSELREMNFWSPTSM